MSNRIRADRTPSEIDVAPDEFLVVHGVSYGHPMTEGGGVDTGYLAITFRATSHLNRIEHESPCYVLDRQFAAQMVAGIAEGLAGVDDEEAGT